MLALEQQALIRQTPGRLDEAQPLLDEAHTLCLQIGDGWSRSRLLTLLGHLALEKGDQTTARKHFGDAYQLARRSELLAHAMAALAGLATLFAAQGDHQRAFTLGQLVLNHRASSHATRQRASQIKETLASHLTAGELATLQARVQTTPFDALVTELLRP
jgi:ATP/maltotriose-dependent transcriptional regulator MalT